MITDPNKVKALAESISEIGLQEPVSFHCRASRLQGASHMWKRHGSITKVSLAQIDVLEVDGKIYGFSGCHRYEVRISD